MLKHRKRKAALIKILGILNRNENNVRIIVKIEILGKYVEKIVVNSIIKMAFTFVYGSITIGNSNTVKRLIEWCYYSTH